MKETISNSIDDIIAFALRSARDFQDKMDKGERPDMIYTANVKSHE